MNFENTLSYAQNLDQQDQLKHLRDAFLMPQQGGSDVIYLCGNSLGLQPKSAKTLVNAQLQNWAQLGVEGWFEGDSPWLSYHKELKALMAPIVGAQVAEVCPMNTLTVNLHLLMVSFYKPTAKRYKVLMEAGAFPSDQYAIESQVRHHGFDPVDAIIEVKPRTGEHILRTEDIRAVIEEHASELALVLFGGINYISGQWFDMQEITRAGHAAGALVGFDLAHAAGNVPLKLHDWEVDFACWCSYKYQNGGPGGIGAIFVHEKHFADQQIDRFAGWWGYQEHTRFHMQKGFAAEAGADGWQVSTGQIIPMSIYLASLQIFKQAGFIEPLRSKSLRLTAYLYFLIQQVNKELGLEQFTIITPADPESRGAQLSIVAQSSAREIFDALVQEGVIGDWRSPNVIRLSPVPLYNTFEELYHTARILKLVAVNVLR
jgi:kynureninase